MKRTLSDPALYLSFLLGLAPLLVHAVYYDQLPMLMASHWGSGNVPDRYTSRFFTAVAVPAVLLVLNIPVVAAIDAGPIGKQGFLTTCCKFLLPAASVILSVTLVLRTIMDVGWTFCVPAAVGVLLVIAAASLPLCEVNRMPGICLPWTLSSEKNWKLTHAVACGTTAVSGFAMMAASFVWTIPLVCTAAGFCILAPVLFSFFYSIKERRAQ